MKIQSAIDDGCHVLFQDGELDDEDGMVVQTGYSPGCVFVRLLNGGVMNITFLTSPLTRQLADALAPYQTPQEDSHAAPD